jgi:hypothetical protein
LIGALPPKRSGALRLMKNAVKNLRTKATRLAKNAQIAFPNHGILILLYFISER